MRDFSTRSGRAQLDVPVEVIAGDDSFGASCKNIGTGGLFVATERPCQIGTQLALKLTLPAQPRPISVGAEVRWTREGEPSESQPSGMGLRFVNLPVGALIAIHELLLGE
ncbi:MAG TPA: TIGR02266 family protein [Polyangia bacterium]|nr:TIGR02266 family protein [Polyangia bacterium]